MTAHKDLLPSFFDELEKIAGSGLDLAHLGMGAAGGALVGAEAMNRHHRKRNRDFINRLESHGIEMKRLPMEVFKKGKEKNASKNQELLTSADRVEFKRLHPERVIVPGKGSPSGNGCSLGKDDKGYFVYTHRARSKSRPTVADIPKKDVEFIGSTS